MRGRGQEYSIHVVPDGPTIEREYVQRLDGQWFMRKIENRYRSGWKPCAVGPVGAMIRTARVELPKGDDSQEYP